MVKLANVGLSGFVERMTRRRGSRVMARKKVRVAMSSRDKLRLSSEGAPNWSRAAVEISKATETGRKPVTIRDLKVPSDSIIVGKKDRETMQECAK